MTATHPGCSFSLNYEPEIIALGERAHSAFPDVPLVSVDILREQPSGRLFVVEVNCAGEVWHFSSRTGKSIQAYAQIDYESQFGGLRRVAQILIDEPQL